MVVVEIDVAALRAENAAQRAQIAILIEQIAKLNERVGELLAVAQRKQRKPPTPAAALRPVELDGAAKLAFDDRPAPPPEKPPKKSRQAKPTGRKPLPIAPAGRGARAPPDPVRAVRRHATRRRRRGR